MAESTAGADTLNAGLIRVQFPGVVVENEKAGLTQNLQHTAPEPPRGIETKVTAAAPRPGAPEGRAHGNRKFDKTVLRATIPADFPAPIAIQVQVAVSIVHREGIETRVVSVTTLTDKIEKRLVDGEGRGSIADNITTGNIF